jgi:hypothetical protein
MALTQTAGVSPTLDGTEQNLFSSQTTLKHYAMWAFLHTLGAGDTVIIRVYANDPQSSTERLYDEATYSGTQSSPAVYIPYIQTNSFRVTVERTAGTVSTINFARIESDG